MKTTKEIEEKFSPIMFEEAKPRELFIAKKPTMSISKT
jgi:hypothetical protein